MGADGVRFALPDWRKMTFGAIALALVAVVTLLAMHHASPPERCVDGMVALGSRCCGSGQTLEDGRCMGRPTACAEGMEVAESGCVPRTDRIALSGGLLQVAPSDWEAAQHRVKHYQVEVEAFAIDSHEVSEQQYQRCVEVAACAALPLSGEPGRARAEIDAAEAARYCRWRGGGLPSADQWRFAAMGTSGRRYPWGDTGAVCRRAAFGLADGPCAWGGSGPELSGSHPAGATPQGVQDLAGNLAEWTTPVGAEGTVSESTVHESTVHESTVHESTVHGGSWRDATATDLRTWQRRSVAATMRSSEIGFRCVYPDGGGEQP